MPLPAAVASTSRAVRPAQGEAIQLAWRREPAALTLLDTAGPFEHRAFRGALTKADPRFRDVSVGGVLADGTRAAVGMCRRLGHAESVPFGYGGVRADRELTAAERAAFLGFARAAAGSISMTVRSLGQPCTDPGASTTMVTTTPRSDVEATWAAKARQAIRRATRAGVTTQASSDPTAFLRLYAEASQRWAMHYPARLVHELADAHRLVAFDAARDGTVHASAVALKADDHWMYWLAAQDDVGRQTEAGYLALAELLQTAGSHGVAFVNLGGSVAHGESLQGVLAFKRRFGGQPIEMISQSSKALTGRLWLTALATMRRARQR